MTTSLRKATVALNVIQGHVQSHTDKVKWLQNFGGSMLFYIFGTDILPHFPVKTILTKNIFILNHLQIIYVLR